jgi:hypothetical protein
MTAQVSDWFHLDSVQYAIAAIQNEWPFDPFEYGFKPVAPHTGCWRGFVATYSVHQGRLVLSTLAVGFGEAKPHRWRNISPKEGESRMWEYRNVDLPVAYSGGIIIASGFLREFYVHMGFHQPYCYSTVKELVFEQGLLVEQRDHSARMESTREMLRAARASAKGNDDVPSPEAIEAFINDAFSLSYERKWA